MRVFDEQRCTDGSQSPVGCVEEGIGGQVVLRTYPLAFQHAPQGLRDVEMRRIRREIEEEKPSAFPDGSHLLHDAAAVDAGVVKHDDGVPSPGSKGQPVEEVRQLLGFVLVELRRGFSLGRFLIRLYLAPMLIKNA